jgi:hypothetical protein
MNSLPSAADEKVTDVVVSKDELTVRLKDGRSITIPLAWATACCGQHHSNVTTGRLLAGAKPSTGMRSTKT